MKKIYEGKAKILFETEKKDILVQRFKDDITAFNGEKKDEIINKGFINREISAIIFTYLKENGIKNHYIQSRGKNEMEVLKLDMIPLEVVVRNIATGSILKRTWIKENTEIKPPIVEFYLKDDSLGDPLINKSHIKAMKILPDETIEKIEENALKTNTLLKKFFMNVNLIIVDMKLEYGFANNEILLGDEISPDTCRIWDIKDKTILDKDRFRKGHKNVLEGYIEILERIK